MCVAPGERRAVLGLIRGFTDQTGSRPAELTGMRNLSLGARVGVTLCAPFRFCSSWPGLAVPDRDTRVADRGEEDAVELVRRRILARAELDPHARPRCATRRVNTLPEVVEGHGLD